MMGHQRFFNLKAEIMWQWREAMNPESKNPIQTKYINTMAEQGASIKWETASNGAIKIQSKKDSGQDSPDIIDAAAIALYVLRKQKKVVQSMSIHEAQMTVKRNPTMRERLQAQKEAKKLLNAVDVAQNS